MKSPGFHSELRRIILRRICIISISNGKLRLKENGKKIRKASIHVSVKHHEEKNERGYIFGYIP